MAQDSRGNIKEELLQDKLNGETGKGKTEVSDVGEEFEVAFIDSKRSYIVDKNGNIVEMQKIIEDKSPGDITKDENGNNIEEDKAYEIWSIEDLVAFSNMSKNNNFENKKVILQRNLNFKSKLSYANWETKDFGDINKDGIIDDFKKIGAVIMTNACGPCIGQWDRQEKDNTRANSIVTSFNRNFAKRADGNPNTHAFVASPETVMALSIAGDLRFNPLKDTLTNEEGKEVKLDAPIGVALPKNGLNTENKKRQSSPDSSVEIVIDKDSKRLQLLKPFDKFNIDDFNNMPLLIKVKGKCTTDHISMAGPWLKFRGHLENISDNMLMGAVNFFNDKTNSVFNQLNNNYEEVSKTAKEYKQKNISSVVVAEENYGEGSSREHAAMEPRFLNVKAVLAKSFARIHETNLKKQGMLAITFKDKDDYNKIQEKDKITILGLDNFKPKQNLTVKLIHKDGSEDTFEVMHTYNEAQIEWFKNGGALNTLMKN